MARFIVRSAISCLLALTVAVTVSASLAGDPGPGGTAPIRPFRLDQVQLGKGMLQEKRDLVKEFVREYDERRFLVLFNNQAGRQNPKGLEPPGGWEDGGLLSGHWTGHYMTALSQAYAGQGGDVYKTKLDWMVKELAACQDAITARMNTSNSTGKSSDAAQWVPTHSGYLGALPEDTVLRLGPPRWAVYGSNLSTNTWAPWYTQHKIIRGLLDAHYNTNNTQALDVVVKMADWAHLALTIGDKNQSGYTGNLTRSDLNWMWDLYIAGEFGGANEVFSEIYQITGDKRHLETAKAFDNRESLFGAAVQDDDILVVAPDRIPAGRRAQRLHANTHVPQFIGYMSVYEQSGEQEYFDAAKNFYGWVVPHRHFAHGGTGGDFPGAPSNSELFQNRGNIANAIAHNGAETCTTYNLLKLARNLFLHEHNATYMDDYERGLFNMIAGSRSSQRSTSDPQFTYFQPLTPGARREYGNTGTCCGGTGMESHTKYQETIYLRSATSPTLYVNLFIPSTLTWSAHNFSLTQDTAFPRAATSTFTITSADATTPLTLNLRVPSWAHSYRVAINGSPVTTPAKPGTYLALTRTWAPNDVVTINMPFTLRTERALDRPSVQNLMWGPLVLRILGAPKSANATFPSLSLYKDLQLDGDYSREAVTLSSRTAAGDPVFSIAGTKMTAIPYYIGDEKPGSIYFLREEPEVVFGGVRTGVENKKKDDGLPGYDVPVEGVPANGHDGPTFLDVVWDGAPFEDDAAFVKEVEGRVTEWVGRKIYSAEEGEKIVEGAKKAKKAKKVKKELEGGSG